MKKREEAVLGTKEHHEETRGRKDWPARHDSKNKINRKKDVGISLHAAIFLATIRKNYPAIRHDAISV